VYPVKSSALNDVWLASCVLVDPKAQEIVMDISPLVSGVCFLPTGSVYVTEGAGWGIRG
jgi:hypothetical protein